MQESCTPAKTHFEKPLLRLHSMWSRILFCGKSTVQISTVLFVMPQTCLWHKTTQGADGRKTELWPTGLKRRELDMRKNDVANHMDLQLFAEPVPGSDPAPQTPPAPNANNPAPQPAASPEAIAAAILSAVEVRTKRAESGVVKSMAEQYGMTDAEVAEILEAERQKRAKQLSPEQQKLVDGQLARANELLIAADVRNTGAVMGLIAAETALLLLDRTNVKVDDKGAVTGVKEALEALKTAKPYLFGTPQAAPDGNAVVRVMSGGAHGGGVEPDYSKMSDEEYYKTIFNKNK